MISINTNSMASNAANALTGHYGRLQTSTQRLSSGLRINSAADDAAGLAIRELMRADIAALNQGVRNTNDAISMLQVMDGALGVIDEKLIRMKELAEQAATGTYDSTQRLMIDSEFQAMGSEIDRIARATDFNGVHLLYGEMITWYEDVTKFRVDNPGTIENLNAGTFNINPKLNGVNPNNYINENNPQRTISISLVAKDDPIISHGTLIPINGTNSYQLGDTEYTAAVVDGQGSADQPIVTYNKGAGWSVQDNNQIYDPITSFNPTNTQFNATGWSPGANVQFSLDDKNGPVNLQNISSDVQSIEVNTKDNTYTIKRESIIFEKDPNSNDPYTVSYNRNTREVTVRLNSGGTSTFTIDRDPLDGETITFDITFEGEVRTEPEERHSVDPNAQVIIHFGPENDSAEDYYGIKFQNCTLEGLGLDGVSIQTQHAAQEALVTINEAIVTKDKARAYLGTMQNRLENTASVNTIQSENLQASESRISDADVAMEMMNFVKNQILTQSALAMLAQANSMPQMVFSLIG